MTKTIAVALLLAFQLTTAQNKEVDNPGPTLISNDGLENIYSMAGLDIKPEFPGGLREFYRYVSKNYRVPDHPELKSGKVFVSFVIEKDGSTSDIRLIRDIGFGAGDEAVRVIKNSPKWTPGQQNGKIVRVMYSLPISITIPEPVKPVLTEPKE